MTLQRIGGNFAPPVDEAKLEEYRKLVRKVENKKIKRVMLKLHALLVKFRETPESNLPGTPHPSGRGIVVPLTEEEVDRLFEDIPSAEECDAYGKMFDSLRGQVRNCAYHLLWYARELGFHREPITNDKL